MYLSSQKSVASSREKLLASAFSSIWTAKTSLRSVLTTVQSQKKQFRPRVFLSQSNLILATKNIYSILYMRSVGQRVLKSPVVKVTLKSLCNHFVTSQDHFSNISNTLAKCCSILTIKIIPRTASNLTRGQK